MNIKYYYKGMTLREFCIKEGIDYYKFYRILHRYKRRFGKEMSVEKAVDIALTPSFKQRILDEGLPPEKYRLVYNRVYAGWDFKKAISTPVS